MWASNFFIYSPILKTARVTKNIWRINTIASIWRESKLGYLSLDIICSSKLTVLLSENCSLLATDNVRGQNPSIFSRQVEAIVYLHHAQRANMISAHVNFWSIFIFILFSFLYFCGVLNKQIFHPRLLDVRWLCQVGRTRLVAYLSSQIISNLLSLDNLFSAVFKILPWTF